MLPSLLTLAGLVQLSRATTNTTTTAGCPSCDATSCNYRSIWSILASCGLTLLICVWHAVHPALPLPHHRWIHVFLYRVYLMFLAFFGPEILPALGCREWCAVKEITKNFHDHGYKWWTMTHSYFVVMGGFALHDDTGIRVINDEELLSLLDARDIYNPLVTQDDIMDKSASDGLGKAILIVQLFWFATQLVVRLVNHLSVTLVELDTVCIALSTPLLLFFWWEKPCCPRRPYIFYARDLKISNSLQEISEGGNGPKGMSPDISTIKTQRNLSDLLLLGSRTSRSSVFLLLLIWSLFGALHAMAWNYEFPTATEQTFWRVSSLALVGSPMFIFVTLIFFNPPNFVLGKLSVTLLVWVGATARVYLIAGMLASLRSLPPSAHETIPWTNYIPHL